MKKELILQGMGWGHMPDYLIEQELRDRRLLPITGRYFKGGQAEIVAARRRNAPHGPIAHRLWQFIGSAGLTVSNRQRASWGPLSTSHDRKGC